MLIKHLMDLKGLLALQFNNLIYEITKPISYDELASHCAKLLKPIIKERIYFEYSRYEGDIVQLSSEDEYQQFGLYLMTNKDKRLLLSLKQFDLVDYIAIYTSDPKIESAIRTFMLMKRKDKAFSALRRMTALNKHLITVIEERMKFLQCEAYSSIRKTQRKSSCNCFHLLDDNMNQQSTQFKGLKYLFEMAIKYHKDSMGLTNSKSICALYNQIKKEIITLAKEYHKNQSKTLNNKSKSNSDADIFHCDFSNLSPIVSSKKLYQCISCIDFELDEHNDDNDNDENDSKEHNDFKLTNTDHQDSFEFHHLNNYFYECLTSNLSYSIQKGKLSHFVLPIVLKNTSSTSWPSQSIKLVCDSLHSSVLSKDASCSGDIQPGQEAFFDIHFDNIDLLAIGVYVSIMHFTIQNTKCDKPMTIKLNIYQSKDVFIDNHYASRNEITL